MSISKPKSRIEVPRRDFDRFIYIKQSTGATRNEFGDPITGATTSTYAERFAQLKPSPMGGTEEMRARKETAVTLVTWRFDHVDGLIESMWIEDENGKIYDIINIHDDMRYMVHSVHCRLRA